MNSRSQRRLEPGWLFRLGLFLVGFPVLVVSGWALIGPEHWYNNFGLTRSWAALGPYNEHLVLDFFLSQLALSLLLLATAVWLSRGLLRLSLVLWLLFAVPHYIYHGAHASLSANLDNVLNLGGLGLQVLVPLALFVASVPRDEPKPDDASGGGERPDTGLEFRGLPEASGPIIRVLSWMTKQQFGQPLETLKLVGHHPWLLFGTSMMEASVEKFDSLDERLHSLVALRVAQIVGCPW